MDKSDSPGLDDVPELALAYLGGEVDPNTAAFGPVLVVLPINAKGLEPFTR